MTVKIPSHIAIIMDGNGRWAQQRGLLRTAGHEAGGKAAKKIVKACVDKGIEVLTLFAFSTENWQRSAQEVKFLMQLLFKVLQQAFREVQQYNIRFQFIGDLSKLNKRLQTMLARLEKVTLKNTGLRLNIAINYSGRWDILEAAKKLAKKVEQRTLRAKNITMDLLQNELCLTGLPEPDLLIRTSGELRISNFLLWQLAYTELYFTDVLWPDFAESDLDAALKAYTERERRFGKESIHDA